MLGVVALARGPGGTILCELLQEFPLPMLEEGLSPGGERVRDAQREVCRFKRWECGESRCSWVFKGGESLEIGRLHWAPAK